MFCTCEIVILFLWNGTHSNVVSHKYTSRKSHKPNCAWWLICGPSWYVGIPLGGLFVLDVRIPPHGQVSASLVFDVQTQCNMFAKRGNDCHWVFWYSGVCVAQLPWADNIRTFFGPKLRYFDGRNLTVKPGCLYRVDLKRALRGRSCILKCGQLIKISWNASLVAAAQANIGKLSRGLWNSLGWKKFMYEVSVNCLHLHGCISKSWSSSQDSKLQDKEVLCGLSLLRFNVYIRLPAKNPTQISESSYGPGHLNDGQAVVGTESQRAWVCEAFSYAPWSWFFETKRRVKPLPCLASHDLSHKINRGMK